MNNEKKKKKKSTHINKVSVSLEDNIRVVDALELDIPNTKVKVGTVGDEGNDLYV